MSQVLFDSAFSSIASPIRRQYGISDADLLGMVSADFYKGLNNPDVTGPKSMLHSLEKEEGHITFQEETPEEAAIREAEEKEQRILGHIVRVELEGCAE
tara:strand:- start:715 stop:1011 length:297 start_codon:yes stop_codon:yes gene_type:complete